MHSQLQLARLITDMRGSAVHVAAGQADGISPRTIEVFQVSIFVFRCPAPMNDDPYRAMDSQNVFCGKDVKYTWP